MSNPYALEHESDHIEYQVLRNRNTEPIAQNTESYKPEHRSDRTEYRVL